jgi:hypothetical protein
LVDLIERSAANKYDLAANCVRFSEVKRFKAHLEALRDPKQSEKADSNRVYLRGKAAERQKI